jgi:hypothetical protein
MTTKKELEERDPDGKIMALHEEHSEELYSKEDLQ